MADERVHKYAKQGDGSVLCEWCGFDRNDQKPGCRLPSSSYTLAHAFAAAENAALPRGMNSAVPEPYARWGGLPAVLGALPDAAEARASDPKLAALLDKLDAIEHAPRTANGIATALITCAFSEVDRNRFNSPLLDGLHAIIANGADSNAAGGADAPTTVREMLERGIAFNVHSSSFMFLMEEALARQEIDGELLRAACEQGRTALAEILLDHGAGEAARDPAALVGACINGHVPVVRLLLQRGFHREFMDEMDLALLKALRQGHFEIVSLLLNHGASADASSGQPLMCAIAMKDMRMVKLLLDHGASVQGFGGDVPLDEACSYGGCDIVRELLDRGAGSHPHTGFEIALSKGFVPILQLFVDCGQPIELQMLAVAIFYHKPDSVAFLLDHGLDIHAEDDAALRKAADVDRAGVVELLLQRGANVHAVNDDALQRAAASNAVECVKILLAHGADIHAADDSALIGAASTRSPEMVSLLLSRGARIHAQDDEALIAAVIGVAHEEAIGLLLDAGADIHARNELALVRSMRHARPSLVALLLDRGADLRTRFDEVVTGAVQSRSGTLMQLLIDHASALNLSTERLREGLLHPNVWYGNKPTRTMR